MALEPTIVIFEPLLAQAVVATNVNNKSMINFPIECFLIAFAI
jgi:hypothetical protein